MEIKLYHLILNFKDKFKDLKLVIIKLQLQDI
jgi:hypothetical protein